MYKRQSLHLAKEYGKQAVFTKASIEKYFNTEKSLPFLARYQNEIIGYIIGIPLEELTMETWALNDENYGKHNTLYTYAFVIMEKYKSNGYAKMLKRVYLSWAQKRDRIKYLLSTKEKIRITKPTDMAVLITNALLSSIAVLISLAFSEITIKPKSLSLLFTFLTVVTLN